MWPFNLQKLGEKARGRDNRHVYLRRNDSYSDLLKTQDERKRKSFDLNVDIILADQTKTPKPFLPKLMWPFNLQKQGEKARGREPIDKFTCAKKS